jgi:hypothetical protein
MGILEIPPPALIGQLIGEHEEQRPALLDPCLINKSPRCQAGDLPQLGDPSLPEPLIQPTRTTGELVSFGIDEAVVPLRSPPPHDVLQPAVI